MDDPCRAEPQEARGGAQEVPSGRGRTFARITGRTLIALASVAALAVTAAGWATLDRFNRHVTNSGVLADVPATPSTDDGATDVLLVGNDSRTDAQGNPLPLHVLKALRTESTRGLNTDTLILLRIPKNGADPTAVSIPRDTYTPVAGKRPEKINAVYGLTKAELARQLERDTDASSQRIDRVSAQAGQRALVQTVQTLTGVRIDHYAEVNLLGFYEVTEAIGGVEVCLNHATRDKDSGAEFSAGRQTISGGDALAFVRQRQGLPRGDLDRIVRQQVFMAAVANKVLSTGTLSDFDKLNHLMRAAGKSVVLDEDWDVAGFAQRMQGLATGNVRFVTLPVTGTARSDRGQSIVTVDPAQVTRFVADLARAAPASNPTGPTPGDVKPPRLGPEPLLRLDGSAHRKPTAEPTEAITSEGVPCVN